MTFGVEVIRASDISIIKIEIGDRFVFLRGASKLDGASMELHANAPTDPRDS
jgi:hypothetical protein